MLAQILLYQLRKKKSQQAQLNGQHGRNNVTPTNHQMGHLDRGSEPPCVQGAVQCED